MWDFEGRITNTVCCMIIDALPQAKMHDKQMDKYRF